MEPSPVQYGIRELSQSEEDLGKIWLLWQTIFPKWPVEQERMQRLLYGLPVSAHYYVHEHGFCLSSLVDGADGKIMAVGVLPEHRGKGLGTALLETAQAGLRRAAGENGGQLRSLELGSRTPRFWPQVPIDLPTEAKDFFLHRGTSRNI